MDIEIEDYVRTSDGRIDKVQEEVLKAINKKM